MLKFKVVTPIIVSENNNARCETQQVVINKIKLNLKKPPPAHPLSVIKKYPALKTEVSRYNFEIQHHQRKNIMTLVMDRHFNPPPQNFSTQTQDPTTTSDLGHLFSRMCAAGALVPGTQPYLPTAASIGPSLTAFQYALLLQHRYHSYANNGLLHQQKTTSPHHQVANTCVFRPSDDVNDPVRGTGDDRGGFRRLERDTDGVLANPDDRQDSGTWHRIFALYFSFVGLTRWDTLQLWYIHVEYYIL